MRIFFLGIDISTQSVKAIVIDKSGVIKAKARSQLPKSYYYQDENNFQCHEQDPEDWWKATIFCIKEIVKQLKNMNMNPQEILGISLSGTSGTILLIDNENKPLTKAIMYNDNRSVAQAQLLNNIYKKHCEKHGYKFSASFAISKLLWFSQKKPKIWAKTKIMNHCIDYIVGKMTSEFSISDYSNALKTGYDLVDLKWSKEMGVNDILFAKFQQIKAPGDYISSTNEDFTNLTDLPSIPVHAGLTDSTASLLSSGAVQVGDLFSVLGSTIVEKVISDKIVKDPLGRLYSHRFPFGGWLPGGAGNVGAISLSEEFGTDKLIKLDMEVSENIPTDLLIYPLTRKGERFPLNNSLARGFIVGDFSSTHKRYAAFIEGLCYTEKMMIDVFHELGVSTGNSIYSVGGGTNSKPWMELRSTIMNKTIKIPTHPEACFGSALLVACVSDYKTNLIKTCNDLIKIQKSFSPDEEKKAIYEKKYKKFTEIIHQKLENEWKVRT